jgi:hypothetical protein
VVTHIVSLKGRVFCAFIFVEIIRFYILEV